MIIHDPLLSTHIRSAAIRGRALAVDAAAQETSCRREWIGGRVRPAKRTNETMC